MKAEGKSYIKFASFFELIMGVVSIALTYLIVQSGEATMIGGIKVHHEAMLTVYMMYAIGAIQIVAALIGFIFAKRPYQYKVLYLFSILLMLTSVGSTIQTTFDVVGIIASFIRYGLPAIYFLGAIKNKNSLTNYH